MFYWSLSGSPKEALNPKADETIKDLSLAFFKYEALNMHWILNIGQTDWILSRKISKEGLDKFSPLDFCTSQNRIIVELIMQNCSVNQSTPQVRIQDRFTSSVRNLCTWIVDVCLCVSHEVAGANERRLYSQAIDKNTQNGKNAAH